MECPNVGTGRWGVPSCSLRPPVSTNVELWQGLSCPSAWAAPRDVPCQMHHVLTAVQPPQPGPPAPKEKPMMKLHATLAPLPALHHLEWP